MTTPDVLTEQDVAAVRAELAQGTPVTVWFTPAAVGVAAGGSAKVVAVDEVAEGDFIQVRPAGSRDTMFCSPGELTRTRPPRRRTARPAPAPEPVAEAVPVTPAEPAAGEDAPVSQPTENTPSTEPTPREDRPRRARGQARVTDVTVTLASTTDGEWTVDVMVGKKRTVKAQPVQPGDVAKAARSLPPEVAEAIESSLDAARKRQIERVERLRAELDAAEKALHELSDD